VFEAQDRAGQKTSRLALKNPRGPGWQMLLHTATSGIDAAADRSIAAEIGLTREQPDTVIGP